MFVLLLFSFIPLLLLLLTLSSSQFVFLLPYPTAPVTYWILLRQFLEGHGVRLFTVALLYHWGKHP